MYNEAAINALLASVRKLVATWRSGGMFGNKHLEELQRCVDAIDSGLPPGQETIRVNPQMTDAHKVVRCDTL